MIKHISTYLPERILDNDELARLYPDWPAEKIYAKTGIRARRIAAADESASDMAFKAATSLIAETGFSGFDFLVLCTQSPDGALPTTACILQHRLNLPTNCGAIDLPLGCSGYVYSLAVARGLIATGVANNVLVLTSDKYTGYIAPEDRSTRTIFGDAASATWLARDSEYILENFEMGSDGSGAGNLNVGPSGRLVMNGPEIFAFTLRAIPQLVERVLRGAALNIDSLDFAVFHQANAFMLEHLRAKLKIAREKFPLQLEAFGNTVSTSIPLTLWAENILAKRPRNTLLVGFGVGYSWGACLLKHRNTI